MKMCFSWFQSNPATLTRSMTTAWSPKDKNRSTDRFQDPISVQDAVQLFPETQSGLLSRDRSWKKAKWWENICFKVLTISMRLKQVVGLDEGHLPQVLWNFQTPRPKGNPKLNNLISWEKRSKNLTIRLSLIDWKTSS